MLGGKTLLYPSSLNPTTKKIERLRSLDIEKLKSRQMSSLEVQKLQGNQVEKQFAFGLISGGYEFFMDFPNLWIWGEGREAAKWELEGPYAKWGRGGYWARACQSGGEDLGSTKHRRDRLVWSPSQKQIVLRAKIKQNPCEVSFCFILFYIYFNIFLND